MEINRPLDREVGTVVATQIQVGDEIPSRGKVLETETSCGGMLVTIKCESSTITRNRYAPVSRYVQ